MPGAEPILVVTGANGYIGSAVVRAARAHGALVHALARRPPEAATPGVRWFSYDLAAPVPDEALRGSAAVVHLAVDERGFAAGAGGDVNTDGTARLLQAARRLELPRFVFVSSQSAATGARSAYARSKRAAEALLSEPGEIVVRPGMVYGGTPAALYGRLCDLVAKRPVLPVPRPGAPVQPVHVDDLAEALVRLSLGPDRGRRLYQIGSPAPVAFSAYLRGIARGLGRRLIVVPVPLGPLPSLLRRFGGRVPALRALGERLAGLDALTPMETGTSLAALGITLRPFGEPVRDDARNRTEDVLFVFAHQDDEVGIATRIAYERGLANTVWCAYLTDGASSASARVRDAESLRALQRLGVGASRVVFLSDGDGRIPDGSLIHHLGRARRMLGGWAASTGARFERIFVTDWEGGHADHDAAHLLALALAREAGIRDVFTYSLYNAYRRPRGLFRVASFVPSAQRAMVRRLTLSEALVPLRALANYRSQLRTWVGLGPGLAVRMLWKREERLRRADPSRLREAPHRGPLFYETKFGVSARSVFDATAELRAALSDTPA
ncbi:MAG TPA: NAD-dependent epimerase/dehydratase family protein [Candidatus Elarobacter sp.]|jgi:nucleoside-diphosphate-sugar epimerase/LmbE family N-acetylglucosaminyl deacetylase|nr:NAD-dependent epimerase/dehydratase family protein [Candidatus Elarobacter sp.]